MKRPLSDILHIVLLWSVISCSGANDRETDNRRDQKENAETANDDRFDKRNEKEEKKDADFIVDAIDNGYALIELAEIGGQQGVSQAVKDHAQALSESQTSILTKLKTYAEDNDISIPLAGPETTRPRVEALYKEDPESFDKHWSEAVSRSNKNMISNFERYANRADPSLQKIIAESLATLRTEQSKLENQ